MSAMPVLGMALTAMGVAAMSGKNSLVATFANHSLAKATIKELQKTGFDMNNLAVVEEGKNGYWDGVTVVDSLKMLGEEQYSCISRETIPDYEAELKAGRLLLFFHGAADEIARAKSIIDTAHPESWDGKVGCSVYYGCLD